MFSNLLIEEMLLLRVMKNLPFLSIVPKNISRYFSKGRERGEEKKIP